MENPIIEKNIPERENPAIADYFGFDLGDGESAVASAQETLAAAQTRHDAVDPETETGAAAWTAAEQEIFGETQEKIDALKADNAALDESIAAVEKEVETKLADEDTAYYNSVYEEMQKGVDQVEEYLKGN